MGDDRESAPPLGLGFNVMDGPAPDRLRKPYSVVRLLDVKGGIIGNGPQINENTAEFVAHAPRALKLRNFFDFLNRFYGYA